MFDLELRTQVVRTEIKVDFELLVAWDCFVVTEDCVGKGWVERLVKDGFAIVASEVNAYSLVGGSDP
jgi:hypothetical protein